jgi:hypothetical protein
MRFNFLDDNLKQAVIQNKMPLADAIRKVKKAEIKLRSHK